MIIPNLMVTDIVKSVSFYCHILGFTFLFSVSADRKTRMADGPDADEQNTGPQPGDVFAIVHYQGAELMLQTAASLAGDLDIFRPDMTPKVSGAVYIRGLDPESVSDRIPGHQILKPMTTTWYGMKEMHISDPDGYVLSLGIQDPDATPPDAEHT